LELDIENKQGEVSIDPTHDEVETIMMLESQINVFKHDNPKMNELLRTMADQTFHLRKTNNRFAGL
jgi:hypothetical protein